MDVFAQTRFHVLMYVCVYSHDLTCNYMCLCRISECIRADSPVHMYLTFHLYICVYATCIYVFMSCIWMYSYRLTCTHVSHFPLVYMCLRQWYICAYATCIYVFMSYIWMYSHRLTCTHVSHFSMYIRRALVPACVYVFARTHFYVYIYIRVYAYRLNFHI